ncbi:hypothetical protein Peur_027816 [Populus x canadensis]
MDGEGESVKYLWHQILGIQQCSITARNGSSVRDQIPNAHVTSSRPQVYWKDDGSFFIQFLVMKRILVKLKEALVWSSVSDSSEGGSKGSLVSSSEWTVKDVELSCSSGPLDITYVVSLYPLNMATAVIVKNNGRKDVTLTSAILRHLKFIRRAKAGIQGLRKCSY